MCVKIRFPYRKKEMLEMFFLSDTIRLIQFSGEKLGHMSLEHILQKRCLEIVNVWRKLKDSRCNTLIRKQ